MERACARGQEEGAHDLADPHAHEPRGVERDAAALGALAQAQRVGHALRERHPHGRAELRVREQRAALRRERAPAALARPPLGAVGVAPLLDERRAPAPRVAVRLLRKAGDLVGYRGLEVGEQLQLLLVRELQHELRYDAFHSPSFLRWLPGKSIVREDLLPACPATGSLARICQWVPSRILRTFPTAS